MSKIDYDPIKDRFASIIRRSVVLRRMFYFLLDLVFLRSWHIRKVLKTEGAGFEESGSWKLIDAGCGFGQYDRFLLHQFENVKIHAIDVKKDYLRDNKSYFRKVFDRDRIEFHEADLLELTGSKAFDFVICIDVLEHIEEDVEVMQNLSKCLREGGYFLMHSPSHYSEEDASGENTFVGEHARTGYSKEDIEKKLMESDLLPVKTHYTYGKWGRRSWVLSVKWPMIWFSRFGMIAALPLFLYYPVVLPFCLIMNTADLYTKNEKGSGIYALARKI